MKKINILGLSTLCRQKFTTKEEQWFKAGILLMAVTILLYVQSHGTWSWYYTYNDLIYLKLWKLRIGAPEQLHHHTAVICSNSILPVRRKASKCLWSRSHCLHFKEKYLPIFPFCNSSRSDRVQFGSKGKVILSNRKAEIQAAPSWDHA